MTLSQSKNEGHLVYFLKKFGWFKGVIGAVVSAFPILANLKGLENKGIIPPLSYDYLSLFVMLLIMVILATYSLRYIRSFNDHKWFSTLLVFMLLAVGSISFLAYVSWQQKSVRCGVVRPPNSKPIMQCVIIGLQRSDYANDQFKGWTDEEMLKKRGWTREQVRKLWKPDSVDKARRRVIGYYLSIPLLLVGVLSILVVRECVEDRWL